MGQYDAFGRKVGEDPLADSGWRAATPAPGAAVAPPEDTPSPDRPVRPQRVGRGPIRGRSLLLLTLFLGAVGTALTRSGGDTDTSGISVPPSAREAPADPATSADPAAVARPPAGLQPGSLLRRQAFARAMSGLRARGLGRPTSVRVAADRINVELLTKGGRLRHVQIDADGEFRGGSASGPGFGFVGTLAYDQIDPAAPARLTRAAAHRRGVSPTRVDYLVLSRFDDELSWSLFFKGGARVQADAGGHLPES